MVDAGASLSSLALLRPAKKSRPDRSSSSLVDNGSAALSAVSRARPTSLASSTTTLTRRSRLTSTSPTACVWWASGGFNVCLMAAAARHQPTQRRIRGHARRRLYPMRRRHVEVVVASGRGHEWAMQNSSTRALPCRHCGVPKALERQLQREFDDLDRCRDQVGTCKAKVRSFEFPPSTSSTCSTSAIRGVWMHSPTLFAIRGAPRTRYGTHRANSALNRCKVPLIRSLAVGEELPVSSLHWPRQAYLCSGRAAHSVDDDGVHLAVAFERHRGPTIIRPRIVHRWCHCRTGFAYIPRPTAASRGPHGVDGPTKAVQAPTRRVCITVTSPASRGPT